ncbi:MAG: hypothetical protein OZ921_10120 [Sorangiineae bacterium]|nr:hypothetical protein [Polyangiaceae bacterium]MEB2322861.1 hypothetical protein [Sorangiineae bacterium]
MPTRFLPVLVAFACSAPLPGGEVDGAVTQREWQWWSSSQAVGMVVVADDAPTPEAEALRATLREALAGAALRAAGECLHGWEPTTWRAIDVRAVVVAPSITAKPRPVGPSDDPALAWSSADATYPQRAAFTANLGAALDTPAPPGARYEPLVAAVDTARLLRGERAPADAREAALRASLAGIDALWILVASLRDDEGSYSPESLEVLPTDGERVWTLTQRIARGAGGGSSAGCVADVVAAARLSRWPTTEEVIGWPCGAAELERELFPALQSCNLPPRWACASRPVLVDADGRAECTATVATTDPLGCDPARGWLDPLGQDGVRRPRIVDSEGGPARLCEIVELAGAARVACQTDPDCPGCGSGFCGGSTVNRLDACGPGARPSGLRFVGGAAGAGVRGHFTIRCTLAP